MVNLIRKDEILLSDDEGLVFIETNSLRMSCSTTPAVLDDGQGVISSVVIPDTFEGDWYILTDGDVARLLVLL